MSLHSSHDLFFGIVFLLVIFGRTEKAATGATRIPVIPQPKQITLLSEPFEFTDQAKIIVFEADHTARTWVIALKSCLPVKSASISLEKTLNRKEKNIYLAKFGQAPALLKYLQKKAIHLPESIGEQGYLLLINGDGIFIGAHTDHGLFYGVQTLRQLLAANSGRALAGMQIIDWPDLPIRGITDDISRGQVSTPENFKTIIDFLAYYKLNYYLLMIEDVFQFKNYPSIGVNRGALSPEEVKILDAYARERFVELVPIFQTLGHHENLLLQPEFIHLAEFPGAHTLAINQPEVYEFLQTTIQEIAAAFSSRYFHIGCDESWDVGKGYSKALVDSIGTARAHALHYQRVYEMVKALGKIPLMYCDIPLKNPDIFAELPKDLILFDWHYQVAPEYPSVDVLQPLGIKYIVSPGVANWRRIFPDHLLAVQNIENFTRIGYRRGAIGAMTSSWGDYGAETLRELNYLGYAYAAECSWSPEQADYGFFKPVFMRQFFGAETEQFTHIYDIMNRITGQVSIFDFRKHPLDPLPLAKLNRQQRLNLRADADSVLRLGSELTGSETKLHADILRFLAQKVHFLLDRLDFTQAVLSASAEAPLTASALQKRQDLGQKLIVAAGRLKDEYQRLWLATNKPEGLELLLSDWQDQIGYLQDLLASASAIEPRPFLKNAITAHVDILASRKEPSQPIYLRKTFALTQVPTKVLLQVAGDSRVQIYVNGQRVGEQIARHALSYSVLRQRVAVREIQDLLRAGQNCLALSVQNFDGRPPSVSVWCEAMAPTQVPLLQSDLTWTSSVSADVGWMASGFDDRAWLPAQVSDAFLHSLTWPNLRSGRAARIELGR